MVVHAHWAETKTTDWVDFICELTKLSTYYRRQLGKNKIATQARLGTIREAPIVYI